MTITSTAWIGRTFPGFMLLDNRVIASIGLAHWPGTGVPGLFWSEVLAVDGHSVRTAAEVYAHVGSLSPGTPVRYRITRDGLARQVIIPSARFRAGDWFLLFGAFLLNGSVILAAGLVPWLLRPGSPLARAFLAWGAACSLFLLTAMDLYGPATLFRLQVVGEAALPAAGLQLALLFPEPHPRARWRVVGWGVAAVFLMLYETFLYEPAVYSRVITWNWIFVGTTGLLFFARLGSRYWRSRSILALQRVRIITIGTLLGFGVPSLVVLASTIQPGGVGMNLAALTPFLFSLSVAYAIVKHDLFEIDAMVKRGAYYLVLTVAVALAYIAAVAFFDFVLKTGAAIESRAFPILFTLAVLIVLNPLRTRLQALVDRVFFRTGYYGARLLAGVGQQLVATLDRHRIAALVEDAVGRALPNTRTRLFVADAAGRLTELRGSETLPAALVERLAGDGIVTAFDPAERYRDAASHDAVRIALSALGAEIAVPLMRGARLTGALIAGRKQSGLFYTAGDAEFLQALAHQAAIALENARSYERLVELNTRLEDRVRERTAQLETANRELAGAYVELKNAETQLVHAEKMASLGRLVAGVAHEINNPVSFISTSVPPLRRRLGQAAAVAPPHVRRTLAEAEDIVGVMARGAERTTAIVRDLRSFSRLDESVRKAVDLHEALEVTLRLLEPRWRGRIEVHRDFGSLPAIECDPSQLNQVFMNILANACDAMPASGNLWITTRVEDGSTVVTFRDDGPGIAADVRGRIFEPFFTTKDVGQGTGLGLAISHGIVTAHGGRLDVESAPGRGATFRITLPLGAPAPARVASAG